MGYNLEVLLRENRLIKCLENLPIVRSLVVNISVLLTLLL